MKKSLLFSLAAGLSAFVFCELALSQDDFDISLPGDETPVSTPVETSSSASTKDATAGELSLLEMIANGGWSMWVLGSFSIAVIGLLVFCLIDLQRKNFHPHDLVESLQVDMAALNFDGAIPKAGHSDACLGAVMAAGLNFIAERGYEVLDSEKLEEVMSTASRKFNRGRVRTINYFSILAQAGPMMGLLGTVSGMIGAFGKLSRGGAGDPSVFAGDISEALITTASGLVVALPAIFCYFIFRDRLQQLVAECDEHAGELLSSLRRAVTEGQ